MTCELWHGDSRELIRTLPDDIDCVITDPPFGAKFRSRAGATPAQKAITSVNLEGDEDVEAALELFTSVYVPLAEKMADESQMFVFTRWDVVDAWIGMLRDLTPTTGFKYNAMQVWDRGYPGKGDIDCTPGMGFELILFAIRGRKELNYRRSGVWRVDRPHASRLIHPTEKPVSLLEDIIRMVTQPGDLVVDPFAGSASTVVAARNAGRRCIGIEKDQAFFDRAQGRLAQDSMFT